MSTFDGLVQEFPDIRIDYFRNHPHKRQPAACFLSHVHSDHLLGLETLKMPFVYCSAATRRLLLRMEKYPHRINFSKGILEARKQTYKHLKSLLRPLPLQTPVELELRPNSHVRVTLFDANHCPGAVMFLIEGQGRAILYTGDVRAETWWVSSIVRNPLLIPYTNGHKRLDCIYLDTTFASRRDIHMSFPTKAEGLAELLQKLSKYPPSSIFYFRAWTLGYEDVWIAISNFLNSQVHVDQYQLGLFQAMSEDSLTAGLGPALTGFPVGNGEQKGCLTSSSSVKIHSCEPRMPCHTAISKDSNTVWITPIISRMSDGSEVLELGAGGGRGDLYNSREIDVGNDSVLEALQSLISTAAHDQEAANKMRSLIQAARNHQDHRIILEDLGTDPESDLRVEDLLKLMVNSYDLLDNPHRVPTQLSRRQRSNVIHFPYSRHSSYSELRNLVQAFRPNDICPCTVDINSWAEELSMESLFGDLCSKSIFNYDQIVRQEVQRRQEESGTTTEEPISQLQDTQRTGVSSTQSLEAFEEAINSSANVIERDTNEDPNTTSRVGLGSVARKLRDAWLEMNKSSVKYSTNKPSVQPPGSDKELVLTDTETTSKTKEASFNSEHEFSDLSDDLDDLSYGESVTIWYSSKSRVSTNEAVPSEIESSGLQAPVMFALDQQIDMERRRQGYMAARACLDGDETRWNYLDLHSMRRLDRRSSSPEL